MIFARLKKAKERKPKRRVRERKVKRNKYIDYNAFVKGGERIKNV